MKTLTAEEFFRNKLKQKHPSKESITLSHELITAEEGMRWAFEYAKLCASNISNPEAELEWITEAIGEGYTKKQLAKQYGVSVKTLNKFIQ